MMIVNEDGKKFDKLIRPVMIVGHVVSFWPLERGCEPMKNNLKILHRIVIFFLLSFQTFFVTADVIHNKNDIEEATECGLISAAFYLAVLRLIVFSTCQKEIRFIFETMKTDWYAASSDILQILNDKCLFSYKVTKLFTSTVAVTMGCFAVVPAIEIFLLDGDKEILPFRGYIFTNHTVSPIFEFVFVINVAAGVFGCGTIAAATSFTLISIIHSAAKFSIVQRKLENLNKEDSQANKAIANCIVDHQKCIRFAEVLEKVISPLALGQFVISTGLLCFAGFQITSKKTSKERLMKYCTFLQSAIFELFLFSFSGQKLIKEQFLSFGYMMPCIVTQFILAKIQILEYGFEPLKLAKSRAVGESAYFSDWVGSSYTKNVQIIMMRVRNPCTITAAKFYDLSLESFSKVLSTSFSYFTVLQAMNE